MQAKALCALFLFLNVHGAQAEHRLFPTDILEKGEADVDFSVSKVHSSNSIHRSGGLQGQQKFDQTSERAEVRYGLGNDWHIGAAWNYNAKYEHRTNWDNGATFRTAGPEGQTNPDVWVKYGFINDKSSPWSLAGEVKVTPNTTGKSADSESIQLTGGRDFGQGLQGFATYSRRLPNGSGVPSLHSVKVGAYKVLTDRITLTPEMSYTKFEETATVKGTHQSGAQIAALVQLAQNTYLRPGAVYYQTAPQERKDGVFRWGEVGGRVYSLLLYQLF